MSDAASDSGSRAAATANICNSRGLHARASLTNLALADLVGRRFDVDQ